MTVTDEHVEALRRLQRLCPFAGFPAGSNMYSFVVVAEDTANEVQGEIIDWLLRAGLLAAVPRRDPLLTDRSPNHDVCPDCECTHDVDITDAGREALKGALSE